MQQPSFLDLVSLEQQPRKAVRNVSRSQYAVLRDTPGLLSQRQHAVLTAIAAIYNTTQVWPTRAEIASWMWINSRLPRNSVSLIAPRLTELSRGTMNRKTRSYIGGGVIEALPTRPCSVASTPAHPWKIREMGGKEPAIR